MFSPIVDITLTALLAAAVVSDLKFRKIPNALTLTAAAAAFAINGIAAGTHGMLFSGAGFAVGVALMLVPFMFGGLGGGDVKLLAAVGAFKGAAFVALTFLGAAAIGGVIALVLAIKRKQLRASLSRIKTILILLSGRMNPGGVLNKDAGAEGAFPYAGAIAAGAIFAFFMLPWIAR